MHATGPVALCCVLGARVRTIVTATAVLWTESLSGRGWHMFPLLAIIGPAALSMWANVAHASGTTLLAQVLAAVPPAGLILSLELVSWQIRRERTMSPRFTPAWKEVWTRIIEAVQQAGQVLTQRELADELNVSRSRVRRAIERNRDEWDDFVGRVEDRAGQAPVN